MYVATNFPFAKKMLVSALEVDLPSVIHWTIHSINIYWALVCQALCRGYSCEHVKIDPCLWGTYFLTGRYTVSSEWQDNYRLWSVIKVINKVRCRNRKQKVWMDFQIEWLGKTFLEVTVGRDLIDKEEPVICQMNSNFHLKMGMSLIKMELIIVPTEITYLKHVAQ